MEDRSKKMSVKNKIKNNKWDGSSIFLFVFAAIFVAMIIRSFTGGVGTNKLLSNGQLVTQAQPIELSFSDVLNKASDIQTMEIRGNEAKGVLRDGTEYSATITYDPNLLSKISENGAYITIDTGNMGSNSYGIVLYMVDIPRV